MSLQIYKWCFSVTIEITPFGHVVTFMNTIPTQDTLPTYICMDVYMYVCII